jgi:hypothetical protein
LARLGGRWNDCAQHFARCQKCARGRDQPSMPGGAAGPRGAIIMGPLEPSRQLEVLTTIFRCEKPGATTTRSGFWQQFNTTKSRYTPRSIKPQVPSAQTQAF